MTYFISGVWGGGGTDRYLEPLQMMCVNQFVHLNSMLMSILELFYLSEA